MIPARLLDDFSNPRLEAKRSQWVGVVDEGVPGVAASIDDGLGIGQQAKAEVSFSQVQPDPLHRVELWRIERQRHEGHVGRDNERPSAMPAGPVEDT